MKAPAALASVFPLTEIALPLIVKIVIGGGSFTIDGTVLVGTINQDGSGISGGNIDVKDGTSKLPVGTKNVTVEPGGLLVKLPVISALPITLSEKVAFSINSNYQVV